jgi:hypothetical protein
VQFALLPQLAREDGRQARLTAETSALTLRF